MKILSPHVYPFRKMEWFNLVLHRSKVQLAPPTGKFHGIQDARVNSKIGYWHYSKYQISASIGNFDFLDQICPKRVFPVENRLKKPNH